MIRKGLTATALCFLAALATSVWGWVETPAGAQIPVHFDALGRADSFGPKWIGFGLMPAVILAVGALMAAAPALDPRRENLRRQPHLYLTGWIGVSVLFALLHAHIVLTVVGAAGEGVTAIVSMPRLVAALLCVLIVITGNYMGKARPNFLAGVKTPWTLSSDIAWEKTHRFAGKLFVAIGIAGLIWAAAAPLGWVLPGCAAMILAAALIATAYSYFAWRAAPDRRA